MGPVYFDCAANPSVAIALYIAVAPAAAPIMENSRRRLNCPEELPCITLSFPFDTCVDNR